MSLTVSHEIVIFSRPSNRKFRSVEQLLWTSQIIISLFQKQLVRFSQTNWIILARISAAVSSADTGQYDTDIGQYDTDIGQYDIHIGCYGTRYWYRPLYYILLSVIMKQNKYDQNKTKRTVLVPETTQYVRSNNIVKVNYNMASNIEKTSF